MDHTKELEAIFSPSLAPVYLWICLKGDCFQRTAALNSLDPADLLIPVPLCVCFCHRISFFPLWWGIGLQYGGLSSSCLPGFLVCANSFKLVSKVLPTDPGSFAWREGCTLYSFKNGGCYRYLTKGSCKWKANEQLK